ncbi:glycosyltransferase family 2 protein [Patescibacteria group bacterium]|nr:glycosyltransferase family 2 protein [Patescibacteria group bacterium]MBU1890902.1 glycosyltransferase family 2 protein [Patescibacteria group bacterium]
MDLSIVILNYKSKGLTKQCLKGIALLKPRLNFETIVVDNASNDGTTEMINEEFPWVKTIKSPVNNGFAAGNNLGIRKSVGKYIMILNPDVAIFNNSLETLYNFMEENPNVGLAGPKLINPDGSVQASCRTFPTKKIIIYRRTPIGKMSGPRKILREHLMLEWKHTDNREVDWMIGACFFVRRSAMEKVGLLDERFFLYLEDVDWCRRFWHSGYKVCYVAEAEMVHYHQRLSAENPGLKGALSYATRVHIISAIKYFAKYYGVKNNIN